MIYHLRNEHLRTFVDVREVHLLSDSWTSDAAPLGLFELEKMESKINHIT